MSLPESVIWGEPSYRTATRYAPVYKLPRRLDPAFRRICLFPAFGFLVYTVQVIAHALFFKNVANSASFEPRTEEAFE